MLLYFRVSLIIFIFASSHCSFFDTEFTSHDHSIHRLTKRQTKKAVTCAVPTESADKTFTIYDLNDTLITNLRAESDVPKWSYGTFQCTKGYLLPDGSNTSSSYCNFKGEWDPPLKKCLRVCPALQTSNVELTCTDKRQGTISTDCNRALPSGSIVKPQCMPFHHVDPKFRPDYISIQCRDDGRWDKELFKCVPDCGISRHRSLLAHRTEEIFGETPWHVAIYSVPGGHLLICGGTLITTNMVLSAAHCFYDEQRGVAKKDPKDYVIVVGKKTSNYSIIDNPIQQSLEISEILFYEKSYNLKANGSYTSDIAILILKGSITVSQYVLPACIRRNERFGFNPRANALGVLSGWGLDENNEISKTLRMAQVRFIDHNMCLKNISDLTLDKFCAVAHGPKPLKGDSGGGLVFKEGTFYYVRGIVSIRSQWSNASITTFTDVTYFLDWIDAVIQNRSEHSSTDSITSTTTVRSFTNKAIVETQAATRPSEAPLSITTSSTTTQLPKSECLANQLKCYDGTCINVPQICDGKPDCPTGEDEASCSNRETISDHHE